MNTCSSAVVNTEFGLTDHLLPKLWPKKQAREIEKVPKTGQVWGDQELFPLLTQKEETTASPGPCPDTSFAGKAAKGKPW